MKKITTLNKLILEFYLYELKKTPTQIYTKNELIDKFERMWGYLANTSALNYGAKINKIFFTRQNKQYIPKPEIFELFAKLNSTGNDIIQILDHKLKHTKIDWKSFDNKEALFFYIISQFKKEEFYSFTEVYNTIEQQCNNIWYESYEILNFKNYLMKYHHQILDYQDYAGLNRVIFYKIKGE